MPVNTIVVKYLERFQAPDWLKAIGVILYQPYKWLFFVPFICLYTAIISTIVIITATIGFTKFASFLAGFLWARGLSFATPMFVNVEGRENIAPKQSYVVVSNHQSQYDILVLYGWLGIDFKWVMKQELRKVPFIGYVCYKLGHIYIDRSDPEKAIDSINMAKQKIQNGTSVLFFPEGTRSKSGNLAPFKKGAFKLAIDLGLPVLPVTISGTREIIAPGSLNLLPGKSSLKLHPPIETTDFSDSNMDELIYQVRQSILS